MKWKINYDRVILMAAECYILLPVIIFLFGWLKFVYAFVGCIVIAGLAVTLYKSLIRSYVNPVDIITKNISFWISIVVIACIWVYMSGIGGYVYQNSDHWVRNPIFNDLSTYSWPVFYDLSTEPETVKSICGSGRVAFSYYFSWWLPVCFVAKLFRLSYGMRNFLLYVWALLGILLIIYLICRKLQRCSWVVPIVLIVFSGLDVVPYWMKNNFLNTFPWVEHIEWWAHYFQYSSNTTQLFWVFNQSIPIWLIVAVLVQLDDAKCIAGISSIAFAYSPWATFGMVPYAIYGSIKGNKQFRSAINVFNILTPVVMLIVFGTFYMAGSGSDGYIGFIFMQYPDEKRRILCNYLLFVLLEFGIYFVTMGKDVFRYKYYWITLFELIFFPLFTIRDVNFTMRGSIPALFMLTIYIINYLIENGNSNDLKVRKYVLIAILLIGFWTPLAEMNRTLVQTSTNNDILQEQVGSFGNFRTNDEGMINTAKIQFFVYDYEEKLFFKFLAR